MRRTKFHIFFAAMMCFSFLAAYIFPEVGTTRATVFTATWDVRGDFENNDSTTHTPTVISGIDTISSPQDARLLSYGNTFAEPFDTTGYRDASQTTADWNTAEGQLKVPFAQSLTPQDHSSQMAKLVGGQETIYAVLTVGNITYLGLNYGKFLAYDSSTQTTTDLTSQISGFWGGYEIRRIIQAGGNIYLAGLGRKFARYVPGSGATSLNTGCSTMYNIYAMTYDAVRGDIYLGGDNAALCRYRIAGASTDLQPRMFQIWANNRIEDLKFANGRVYLTGGFGLAYYDPVSDTMDSLNGALVDQYGTTDNNYAVLSAGNDTYIGSTNGILLRYDNATGVVTENLKPKIYPFFSTYTVGDLLYANGKIYFTGLGMYQRFGSYDPATGTATDLRLAISACPVYPRAMTFDSLRNDIYIAGNSGYMCRYRIGGAGTDLSAKTRAWMTNTINALAYANDRVYIGADYWLLYYDIATDAVYSLNGTMGTFFGMGWMPTVTAVLSVGNDVYLGWSDGKFWRHNTASNTITRLESYISSFWSGQIYDMVYMGGEIYLSGVGRFAKFNPLTNVGTNLYAPVVSSGIVYNYKMTRDSVGGYIYIVGYNTFGRYRPATNTAQNLYPDLSGDIAGFYGNMTSVAFSAGDDAVYLGANYGYFYKFDPALFGSFATISSFNLTSEISTQWGSSHIYDMVYHAADNQVYLGGNSRRFGRYSESGGFQSIDISSFFGGWYVNTLEYQPNGNYIYFGGNFGAFSRYHAISGGEDLRGDISSFWGNNYVRDITPMQGSSGAYLGGDYGNYARWDGTATDLRAIFAGFFSMARRIFSLERGAGNTIYIGMDLGRFAALDAGTNNVADLTSDISALWGSTTIETMSYDSGGGQLYLGGASGKFMRYSPAYSLDAKISPFWSGQTVNAVSFNQSRNELYMVGGAGKFAMYDPAVPPDGVATDLSSRLSDYMSLSVRFYVLEYVSPQNALYLGGQGRELVRYAIASDAATRLTSLVGFMGFYILALELDPSNGDLYMGGSEGAFGKLNTATDVATSLAASILPFWGSNYMYDISNDSSAGKMFLGGQYTRFAEFVVSGGPATSLISRIGEYTTFLGTILGQTYDSVNNMVYLGISGGLFARYNPATGIADDLTGTISSFWGGGNIEEMVFDYERRTVYLGGTGGRFARYNPATGLATDLRMSSGLDVFWGPGVAVYGMAFAAITDEIYIGGYFGFFAVFDIIAGIATDKRVSVGNFFGQTMYAVALDPVNNFLYLGGTGARFARYQIGTEIFNDLTSSISSFWSTSYPIRRIVYSSTEREMYLGGGYEFAKYDIAPNAATDLYSSLPASTYVYSLAYDTPRNLIYVGGASGRFVKHNALVNSSFDLTARVAFGSGSILSLAYSTANGRVYLGGANSFKSTDMTDSYYAYSTTINTLSLPIGYLTMFVQETPNQGAVVYQVTNNGGAQWYTVRHAQALTFPSYGTNLKFRIVLEWDAAVQNLQIDYGGVYSQGTISGLKVDTGSSATFNTVSWSATLNGQTIQVRSRTAATEAGLAAATWSAYYTVSPSTMTSPNNRWLELELRMESTGAISPVLHSLSVVYDAADLPPDVEIVEVSDASGTYPATPLFDTLFAQVDLSGNAVDASGINQVSWTNSMTGGSGVFAGSAPSSLSWEFLGIPLDVGDNVITVSALDFQGVTGQGVITVRRAPPDSVNPTITIESPSSDPLYATLSSPVAISGAVADDTLVDRVEWFNNNTGVGGTATVSGNTWDPLVYLTGGDNNITVTAYDVFNNAAQAAINIIYVPGGFGSDTITVRYVPGLVGSIQGWTWGADDVGGGMGGDGGGLGWLSMNCLDGDTDGTSQVCDQSSYGVDIDPDLSDPYKAVLKGYAWSADDDFRTIPPPSGFGWLRFDPGGPYPDAEGNVRAAAYIDASQSNKPVYGWAKFCSALRNKGGCSGSQLDDYGGGWDGNIQLHGESVQSNFGVYLNETGDTCELEGWAWGSSDDGGLGFNSLNQNVGWISFNCTNGSNGHGDDGVACSASNYKAVINKDLIDFAMPPSTTSVSIDAVYKLEPKDQTFDFLWNFNGICQEMRGFEIQIADNSSFTSPLQDPNCEPGVAVCCTASTYCSPGTIPTSTHAQLSLDSFPATYFGRTLYWRMRTKAASSGAWVEAGYWSGWSNIATFDMPQSFYPTAINIRMRPAIPSVEQATTFENAAICYSAKTEAPCENYLWNFQSDCNPQPDITTVSTTSVSIVNTFHARCATYAWLMPASVGNVCSTTGPFSCPPTTDIEIVAEGGNRLTLPGLKKAIPEWKEVIPSP